MCMILHDTLHSISDKIYEVFRFLVTVVFYECCLRLIFPLNVFWEDVGLGEERMREREAGWRGGWTFLAVKTQMKERITGSHFLCERDREGNKEQDNAWKRESQSEREASKPLKETLRLTPSRPPPHTQYSPSQSVTVNLPVFLWRVIWFGCFWENNVLLWFTHCKCFDRPGGKAHQKKL